MNRELFYAASDYAQGVLAGVQDHQLVLATPCSEWNVSQVIWHLNSVAGALRGLLATGELVMPEEPSATGGDPVATALVTMNGLLRALAEGEKLAHEEAVFQAGSIEFTAHGWDIGVALDPRHAIPENLATDTLTLASVLIHNDMRGENFSAPIKLKTATEASDELMAFLGRHPDGRN